MGLVKSIIQLDVVNSGENGVSVGAFYHSEIICTYNFYSEKKPHNMGKELILATLTSWATIDLCFVDLIEIQYPLTQVSQDYILKHFNYIMPNYEYTHNNDRAKISFTYPASDISSFEKLVLDKEKYLLGYTGGKDSTLCNIILQEAGKQVTYYTISYDDDNHAKDGHIDISIKNKYLYEKLSRLGIEKNSNYVSFHQADDIHPTFVAPYYDLNSTTPANLVVGLPWDVIHSFKDGYTDLVPTETYGSICILEEFYKDLGISNFRVISPIAVLHSFGVYQAVKQLIGFDRLMSLDSCWNSYMFKGEQCGTCPKCQRLKVIYEYSFNSDYLDWAPSININIENLFGSIYATSVLNKHMDIQWNKGFILDWESLKLVDEFLPTLMKLLNFPLINGENLQINFKSDVQLTEELIKDIVSKININYNNLLDKPISEIMVPWLPFEEDYNWNRQNRVLNCYGRIPLYDDKNKKWEEIIIEEHGPKLILPDLEVFRRWLNKDNIFSFSPELSKFIPEYN
ncbi:hypothetical protein P9B03_09160 [Metasolibacillus meyeri]|uniref:7-cyano-7-deazaguanine synthase n=1 Tax=Metasolibacillus meyeri TaxID=1071052 RepID=A0AAW9NRT1_9BACL|nr:hypothetical protein [Metasolibacillus meyeri]MEC1178648.1 hypothetical protein [Metasolibacillus meyeri]